MIEIKEIIDYVHNNLPDIIQKIDEIGPPFKITARHITIIKGGLVFQYLYQKHYNDEIPIEEIVKLHEDGIGLLGPGDVKLTAVFHRLFGWQPYIRYHGILHDAFGQFYDTYWKDNDYFYSIDASKTCYVFGKCPLLGKITGLHFCIKNKIII